MSKITQWTHNNTVYKIKSYQNGDTYNAYIITDDESEPRIFQGTAAKQAIGRLKLDILTEENILF